MKQPDSTTGTRFDLTTQSVETVFSIMFAEYESLESMVNEFVDLIDNGDQAQSRAIIEGIQNAVDDRYNDFKDKLRVLNYTLENQATDTEIAKLYPNTVIEMVTCAAELAALNMCIASRHAYMLGLNLKTNGFDSHIERKIADEGVDNAGRVADDPIRQRIETLLAESTASRKRELN